MYGAHTDVAIRKILGANESFEVGASGLRLHCIA